MGLLLVMSIESGGLFYWCLEFVRKKDSGLIYILMKLIILDGFFILLVGLCMVINVDDEWEFIIVDEFYGRDLMFVFFLVVEVIFF